MALPPCADAFPQIGKPDLLEWLIGGLATIARPQRAHTQPPAEFVLRYPWAPLEPWFQQNGDAVAMTNIARLMIKGVPINITDNVYTDRDTKKEVRSKTIQMQMMLANGKLAFLDVKASEHVNWIKVGQFTVFPVLHSVYEGKVYYRIDDKALSEQDYAQLSATLGELEAA